jgi:hypothetical protein
MSDFLFASPTFLTGCARTIDLGAVLNRSSYNFSPTPEGADLRGIALDWRAVGKDLQKAMLEYRLPEGK